MQIEITSICNKHCEKCYRTFSDRKLGHMNLDLFKEIVDKIEISRRLDKFLYLAGFGESLLNPDFWDMVRYARKKNFSLMLPTNGTLLNDEVVGKMRMLNDVQLSIDSLNDESLNYLKLFKNYQISVQLNIVLNRLNYHNLRNFIHFGIKNDVRLYFMHTTPFNCSDKDLIDDFKFCLEKFNETLHMISQYFVTASLDIGCISYNACRYLNHDFAIAWNGDIKPCNDGLLLDYDFGNVRDFNNFDTFMESELYKSVSSGVHPICSTCKKIDSYLINHLNRKLIYDKRLDYYENLHKNDRCFVIGHAPTLTRDILKQIEDEITISVNLVGHAKKWGFEPTYYAIGDCGMVTIPENRKFIDMLEKSIKFYPLSIFDQSAHSSDSRLTFDAEDMEYLDNNMIPVNWLNPQLNHNSLVIENQDMISFDLRRGIVEAGTSIQQMAIPLAAWFGCKEIYLVGCDIGYKGRFYDPPGIVTDSGSWPGTDIFIQYGWMKNMLEKRNQLMFNIGPSKMPGVPNKSIEEIFK